jgi:hypothetical protein
MRSAWLKLSFIARSPASLLRAALTWLLMRMSRWESYRGLHIAAVDGVNELNSVARIRAAIRLIEQYAPYGVRYVERYTNRIFCIGIGRSGAAGAFQPLLDVCLLDPRYVLDSNVADVDIASAIVHEATHARIQRFGIRWWKLEQVRVEQLCIRAQLRLLKEIPGTELRIDDLTRVRHALLKACHTRALRRR